MPNLLNLTKTESDNLLDLRKEKLEMLCLEKRDLSGLTARVAIVLDYSGSMSTLYRNGTIQATIERLYPIAESWDDNGEMELWIFSDGFYRLPNISRSNYYGYVEREIMNKGYRMAGTQYSPVIADVAKKYTEEEPAPLPDYIIFITDGDCFDRDRAANEISKVSKYPIFWQFVGIGNASFRFLESLDDMSGRYIDNANFFKMMDVLEGDDEVVYNKLLAEFPEWLKDPKVKQMLIDGYTAPHSSVGKKGGFFSKLFG
jgi:hypothetical protein